MPNKLPTAHEPKIIALAAPHSKSSEFMNILAWFCAGLALSSVIMSIFS